MAECELITSGVSVDCDFPMQPGANDRLILFNFDHLDSYTRNGTNQQIIEAILLTMIDPSNMNKAFAFEGKNGSVEPTQSMVVKKYSKLYDHKILFKVFKALPADKKTLEALGQGRVGAIVENNYRGASENQGKWELYGTESGLIVKNLERVIADADTGGAFAIELGSAENALEGHLPATIFITDAATTKAMIEALL